MQTEIRSVPSQPVGWKTFLRDVFICSLGAYGGPEAHYGVFTDQLITKKKYITEEELVELIALTGILPGPSSTQTIVAIGYKMGGPLLAFFTMLVWALPVLTIMTLLSFLSQFLDRMNLSQDGLRYIGPMAVGFIIVAAWRIGRKVVKDHITAGLLIAGAFITYFIREPWVFPLVLIGGGVVSVMTSGEKDLWNRVDLKPPWAYLAAFGIFALGSLVLSFFTDHRILDLFEKFYRYGYLVIGGGQVVIPLMYSELVEVYQYMSNQEFLTGFGLVQGLPGPMFSFSAYAGGMAARGESVFFQALGAVVSGVAIFLPGLLLIYFIIPVWENIKNIRGIKVSLKGVTAVAGGLIAVAAVVLMQRSGFVLDNLVVTALTTVLLFSKKVPAPLIVVLVLAAGFIV
ncbi:chromate efflux transporter [Anoxynatronum buryatiense]|uniref:Chromate transporter n=1 Tax=Anoxynatronum buryatiense TaxID=489973 RepID=A0AA46AKR2_9CLOT|nr:chromate efflux transporter [Anoxynatronum buryatiense]SMP72165.1 chromate transporter [Anoxynatronum buryatiense]